MTKNDLFKYKIFFVELCYWLASTAIAVALLYPIWIQISYIFLGFQFMMVIMCVQLFRWIMSFHNLNILKNSWVKFISLWLLGIFSFFSYNKIQAIVLILEDQDLSQIAKGIYSSQGYLSLPQIYDLFRYIYQTLLISGYPAVALAIILMLRIIVSYIGYDNPQMKRYLNQTNFKTE